MFYDKILIVLLKWTILIAIRVKLCLTEVQNTACEIYRYPLYSDYYHVLYIGLCLCVSAASHTMY